MTRTRSRCWVVQTQSGFLAWPDLTDSGDADSDTGDDTGTSDTGDTGDTGGDDTGGDTDDGSVSAYFCSFEHYTDDASDASCP